jgi:hypothetical protein
VRLAAHAGALAIVLAVFVVAAGPIGVFSVDEGMAASQARHLATGAGWSIPAPLGEPVTATDPQFPIRLAESTGHGWATFAKHPLYAVSLAAADRVGGAAGMVGLSVVGGVAAALGAAALGRALGRPDDALAALWLTGLATPLLFDSGLLIAHTLGAAAVAAVACACLRDGRHAPAIALGALGAAAAVMLRSEAILLIVAVAVVAAAGVLRRRAVIDPIIATAVVVGGSAAWFAELIWHRAITTPGTVLNVPVQGGGWVRGRVDATWITLLRPSGGAIDEHAVVIGLAFVLIVTGLVLLRAVGGVAPSVAVVVGGVLLVSVALAGSTTPVSGLLPTAPVVVAGLVALRPGALDARARAVGWVVLLTAGAIAATQYKGGGGVEWGGRYFAILLPLVVPLAVVGLRSALAGAAPPARRLAIAGLALATVGLAVLATVTLRDYHRRADSLLGRVDAVAVGDDAGGGSPDAGPIVVTRAFGLPRLDWERWDQHRWVLLGRVEPVDGVDPQITTLLDRGVTRFTLVSNTLETDLALLGERVQAVRQLGETAGFHIVEIGLRRS